jgi:hypothetical protein
MIAAILGMQFGSVLALVAGYLERNQLAKLNDRLAAP